MSTLIVSEKIIKAIAKSCDNSENMFDFLIKLLCEETEHPSQWQYKEIYRKCIEKHCKMEVD